MVLGGLVGLAPQAAASTIWDFPQSTFTIKDSLGATASVVVTNLRVVDGAASGFVNVNGGRFTCQSGSFSGLQAQFTVDRFSPCYGSIWFDVSPSGVLTLSDTNLNGSGHSLPWVPVTEASRARSGS